MAESTTIYTPDAGSASVNSMLPWLMGNRGGFGGNGWSDLIALLVVWGIFGNNGFGGGFGGNNAALTAMATNNQDLINDSYREGYRRGMEEAEMRRRHGGY